VGSGFKTFTAGSVLTASDVQNYLQDQAVMVFGGTAARSSAIGTANFEEGMLTYLTDVDKLQVYTGSSFQDVYPPAATSQGMTLINTTSFSAVASQSINDVFSSTYTNYRIYINAKSSVGETDGRLRLRVSGADASGVNYVYANSSLGANGTSYNQTSGGNSFIVLGRIGANGDGQIVTDISKPNEATRTTTASYIACDGTTTFFNGISAGLYALTTVFTGFTFIAESGTMTGSVSVYGYNK
jgi:hypothetical protein